MDAIKGFRFPLGLTFIGLLLTLFFLYMAIPKKWEDATKIGEDGSITLADDWARTIEKKKSKYRQHDLYMLVAASNGYFLCAHCPTGKFYLNSKEVYRYGTSGNGRNGRGYTKRWLSKNNLAYVHILTAESTIILTTQTNLIGTYTLHPENLSRPTLDTPTSKPYWYRLVIPPGNSRLD